MFKNILFKIGQNVKYWTVINEDVNVRDNQSIDKNNININFYILLNY